MEDRALHVARLADACETLADAVDAARRLLPPDPVGPGRPAPSAAADAPGALAPAPPAHEAAVSVALDLAELAAYSLAAPPRWDPRGSAPLFGGFHAAPGAELLASALHDHAAETAARRLDDARRAAGARRREAAAARAAEGGGAGSGRPQIGRASCRERV